MSILDFFCLLFGWYLFKENYFTSSLLMSLYFKCGSFKLHLVRFGFLVTESSPSTFSEIMSNGGNLDHK